MYRCCQCHISRVRQRRWALIYRASLIREALHFDISRLSLCVDFRSNTVTTWGGRCSRVNDPLPLSAALPTIRRRSASSNKARQRRSGNADRYPHGGGRCEKLPHWRPGTVWAVRCLKASRSGQIRIMAAIGIPLVRRGCHMETSS